MIEDFERLLTERKFLRAKRLIKKNLHLLKVPDAKGNLPLHLAAMHSGTKRGYKLAVWV
ncbi:hypothetical protein [Simkania sp.]|uniref:hypothetical protein n=1 Tax=Simkania sp. TaxID=34094 RepID=UPI003B5229EA